MKLYDYPAAPNPRRVKIFAAEKGQELELVLCDMARREHRSREFLAKNPSGKIPVLELDNGQCIAESIAICRYLEALQPEPNLFGLTALETAKIEASNRQIEFELWEEIRISWRHGPVIAKLGILDQIPEAKQASDALVLAYYQRLDEEFGTREFACEDRFTVADITLATAIDFASNMVGLSPSAELTRLAQWRSKIGSRPSFQAHPSGRPELKR